MDHLGHFLQPLNCYVLKQMNCKLQTFAENFCFEKYHLDCHFLALYEHMIHKNRFKIYNSSTLWKKVALGDVASRKNEEKSVDLATKICTSLMEETQHVLQKVPLILQCKI